MLASGISLKFQWIKLLYGYTPTPKREQYAIESGTNNEIYDIYLGASFQYEYFLHRSLNLLLYTRTSE